MGSSNTQVYDWKILREGHPSIKKFRAEMWLAGGRATQGREAAAMESAIRENYTYINLSNTYSGYKNY
jgi:hypothetical protein